MGRFHVALKHWLIYKYQTFYIDPKGKLVFYQCLKHVLRRREIDPKSQRFLFLKNQL